MRVDKAVYNFSKVILKLNLITPFEFKLVYSDVAIQHVSNYTTGNHSSVIYFDIWKTKFSEIYSHNQGGTTNYFARKKTLIY